MRVGSQGAHGADNLRGAVRIGGHGKASLYPERHRIRLLWSHGDDGFSRRKNSVHFAGYHHTFQAAFHGNDVGVGRCEHRRDFVRRKKIQKTDIPGIHCRRFDLRALRSITNKYQANSFISKVARGGDQGVPRTVESKIACVHKNKRRTSADRAYDFGIGEGERRIRRKDFSAIANDQYAGRVHAFSDNPGAHVFSENDYRSSAPERPAVKFLPYSCKYAGLDNRASHSHVRIHVADVVSIGLAFQ